MLNKSYVEYLEKHNIAIYETADGKIDVKVKNETVWLSLNQLSGLFNRHKSVVSKHLKNIFNEELEFNSVVAKFATTASDGKTYQVEHYNLDVILSIGYRVNSKRGIQFRRWASTVLKEHIIKGYTLNQNRLMEKGLTEIEQSLNLLSNTLIKQSLISEIGLESIKIIIEYARTWNLLLKYDENNFLNPPKKASIVLEYETIIKAINELKYDLINKKEASDFFGQIRNDSLKAILNNIDQTFDGNDLYSSKEEKAANLLYFVIKDHPFIDGNKRIGSFLFLLYLKQQNIKFNKITDVALVALSLLIAESNPSSKELLIKLITNLLIDFNETNN